MFWPSTISTRGPLPWTCSKPWKRWCPCTMWGQGPVTNRHCPFSTYLSQTENWRKRGVWTVKLWRNTSKKFDGNNDELSCKNNVKTRHEKTIKIMKCIIECMNIMWHCVALCDIVWHCVAESHHASRLNVANAQDTSDVFAWISRPGMPPEEHHWIWNVPSTVELCWNP